MPYFAISPFSFGLAPLPSPGVKYRIFPCGEVDPSTNVTGATANYLTVDMMERLNQSDYCFLFQVQFQVDPCKQPINDFSVEWLVSLPILATLSRIYTDPIFPQEEDSPYITFATINIPKQQVQVDTNLTCRHTAFNV